MRRNKTLLLNMSLLKPHLPIIICFSVFIIGVMLGCLLIGNSDFLKNAFFDKLSVYISVRKSNIILDVVVNSFKNIFPYYFLIFLVGTSVIGCALAPVILLYYGFSYGCLSGILYSTFALEGIMLNALVFVPTVLFCAFGLGILLKDAVSFSYLLSGICIKANKPVNIYVQFKNYCTHGIITLSVAAVALIFDIAMSTLFINYFQI